VLGLLVGAATVAAVPHSLQLLVGVGFCGALTTYSTFSYETLHLHEDGADFHAVANVVISVSAALGAAFVALEAESFSLD